jgi:hypothetical protein
VDGEQGPLWMAGAGAWMRMGEWVELGGHPLPRAGAGVVGHLPREPPPPLQSPGQSAPGVGQGQRQGAPGLGEGQQQGAPGLGEGQQGAPVLRQYSLDLQPELLQGWRCQRSCGSECQR